MCPTPSSASPPLHCFIHINMDQTIQQEVQTVPSDRKVGSHYEEACHRCCSLIPPPLLRSMEGTILKPVGCLPCVAPKEPQSFSSMGAFSLQHKGGQLQAWRTHLLAHVALETRPMASGRLLELFPVQWHGQRGHQTSCSCTPYCLLPCRTLSFSTLTSYE